jgi:hypothetical protein
MKILLAILTFFSFLYVAYIFLHLKNTLYLPYDTPAYIANGIAVVEKKGYGNHELRYKGNTIIIKTKYPPLYPLLLAGLYKIISHDYFIFSIYVVHWIMYYLMVIFVYAVLTELGISFFTKLVIVILICVNKMTLFYCLEPASEGLYSVLNFLAILSLPGVFKK